MESYRGRPPGSASGDIESVARQTIDDAGSFLRRLIPLPGSDAVAPLSLLPLSPQSGGPQSNPVTAAASIVGDQAASIVSQAASVLDEEMAKGVLAARSAGTTAPYGASDPGNAVLRQMHDFVDNLAALWPNVQSAPAERAVGSRASAPYADPLAEVRPRMAVNPGQRATISMTLRNSENRPVRLAPAATDLLGSRSGRIACSLLEFSPAELSLEPQEQKELAIATTVPVDAAPGCYSGLLVVRGLEYLRALITIDVV